MGILRQVGLLTAGAQPWNSHICSARGNRFAYCATLAVYIYEYDDASEKFKLHSIMCEHTKTITAISWHKDDINIFASCSIDGFIIVWHVNEQKVIGKLTNIKTPIINIEWHGSEKDTLSFMSSDGPLLLWRYTESESALVAHTKSQNFTYEVCIFKWNLKDKNKVCYGHNDGSISICGGKLYKHILGTMSSHSYVEDKVLSLEWDPLSVDYVLVSTEHSGIRLIDTASRSVITHFKLPKVESTIQKVCWVSTAPGMFISGDSNSAIFRIWSVAQDTPIVNIQVKEKGFLSLFLMEEPYGKISNKLSETSCKVTKNAINVPPISVVCVFVDGGLGVYHLKRRKWMFLREKGHTETIFACDFHPCDPNILATCSFDGSIKVWNITTMTPIHVSPGNLSVIYSLCWGPGDTYSIYAATSKYGAILWDIKGETVAKEHNKHGGKSVYSCCCSRMDADYFASAGSDGQCIVNMAGNRKYYKHPAPVYGCDWCPSNRDLLATGCEDGIVRIYYIPGKLEPLKTFSGHTKKVFSVKWSPLKDGVLCSGSDDKTIRIWDYTQEKCIHCLEGHSSVVRGLLWSPELPNILISGSWDATLRIWDTRTGYCIEVADDHAADVYGLACHPHRPFLLASTSRDSTLRLWTMQNIVQPLYASLVLVQNINFIWNNENVLGKSDAQSSSEIGGQFLKFLEAKKSDSQEKKLQMYSHFLLPPAGIGNFWVLVSIIKNKNKAVLPTNYSDMIMHASHLTSYKASEAQVLLATKSNFHQLIGPKKKAEQLAEAARMYMSLGNTERYCEIMVELNEWEKALSVAPAVSMEYWRLLSKRYAACLTDEEDENAAVHWMASKNIKLLCESYLESNQYHEAMLAVQVAVENHLTVSNGDCDSGFENHDDNLNEGSGYSKVLYNQTNEALANWYFADGNHVLAACCHLSVNNVHHAICKLLRGNELELAYSLSKILPTSAALRKEIAIMFSKRCERYKLWDAALSLWTDIEDNDFELFLLCARHPGTDIDRNAFHAKAGLPSVSDCTVKAKMYSTQGNDLESCKFYIVSNSPEKAVNIIVKNIKSIFAEQAWTLSEVLPYSTMLGSVRSEVIQQLPKDTLHEVLAISSYVGALQAVRFEYTSIVTYLFQTAMMYMKEHCVNFGIISTYIKEQSEAWLVHHIQEVNERKNFFIQKPTSRQKDIYEELVKKCGSTDVKEMCGDFIVVGHHIPAHRISHTHTFNGEPIKGPVFILENGKAALPHSYAVMWAKVNPFSPLGSGYKLNPY